MKSYDVKNLTQQDLVQMVTDSRNSQGKTDPYDIQDRNSNSIYQVNAKDLIQKGDKYIIVAITNKENIVDQFIYADDNKGEFGKL